MDILQHREKASSGALLPKVVKPKRIKKMGEKGKRGEWKEGNEKREKKREKRGGKAYNSFVFITVWIVLMQIYKRRGMDWSWKFSLHCTRS